MDNKAFTSSPERGECPKSANLTKETFHEEESDDVIVKDCGSDYPHNLDVCEMFNTWLGHKKQNIVTYRDQSFASKFTGKQISTQIHCK